jgi:NADPH2:quinone reductase
MARFREGERMHAWLCENPVGVDALQWKELPTPQPKAGEVLVAIKAASLNFPDLLIVQNKYQMKPPLPFVPGSEYAGVVEAVGEGVTHLKVGQNGVACLSGTGGFGTHTIAPAALCMPLPKGFPFVDAAAFIMIYATSHHALVDRAQLKAGETVLVLGAAGGVGTSAIQIAKAMGAKGHRGGFHRREVRAVHLHGRRRHHQLQPGQPFATPSRPPPMARAPT